VGIVATLGFLRVSLLLNLLEKKGVKNKVGFLLKIFKIG
jgi:hypothetical protein